MDLINNKKIIFLVIILISLQSIYSQCILDKSKLNILDLSKLVFSELQGNSLFNYAKEEKVYKIDSIISVFTNGIKSKRTFEYNLNDKLSEYKIELEQDKIWVNLALKSNYYDSSDRIISIETFYWTGNLWAKDLMQNFEYDSTGNKIKELDLLWNNNTWNNNLMSSYTFDTDKNILETVTKKWDDNQWINLNNTRNEYYENKLEGSLFYEWDGSEWNIVGAFLYEYDSINRLKQTLWKKHSDNAWHNYARVNYTYDSSGIFKVGLFAIYDNNNWYTDSRYLEYRNEQSCFTRGVNEQWTGSRWEPDEQPINVENPDGFLEHILAHEVIVYYNQPTSVVNEKKIVTKSFELFQNYPNPFNPSTTISFNLPTEGRVTAKIFDIMGREVITLLDEERTNGLHQVVWNSKNKYGSDVASGIYFYNITFKDKSLTKKIMLMK